MKETKKNRKVVKCELNKNQHETDSLDTKLTVLAEALPKPKMNLSKRSADKFDNASANPVDLQERTTGGHPTPSTCEKQLMHKRRQQIQKIIKETYFSIEKYKKEQLFNDNETNSYITMLNEMHDKTLFDIIGGGVADADGNEFVGMECIKNKDYEHLDDTSVIEQQNNVLKDVIFKLGPIMKEVGTNRLEDLLYVLFGNDYEKETMCENISTEHIESICIGNYPSQAADVLFSPVLHSSESLDNPDYIKVLSSKYNLLKEYAHPIGYKIIQISTKKQQKNTLMKNKKNKKTKTKVEDSSNVHENVEELRASPERSAGEDQFSVACEGKWRVMQNFRNTT